MQQTSRTVGVLLAAGTGSRFGSDLPKQFLRVAGRTIIEHAVDAFEDHPMIDDIIIVMHPAYLDEMKRLVNENRWEKIWKVLPGGKERFDSSLNAIEACSGHPDWKILLHDAARALVPQRIITEVVMALDRHNAVDVVIPATDTVIQTDPSGRFILEIPDRRKMRSGQTPQGFRVGTIEKAYRTGMAQPDFFATDDCGIVARYLPEEPIFLVDGDPLGNMKVTYPSDLQTMENYLASLG